MTADRADWEARRTLANAELALGQRSEALRDMRDCLEARPEDPRVWRDYLNMLQSLGERDAFDAALARVPAIVETEPELWILRGRARERAGDWAAAAADYRRALKLKPNLSNAHYRLAAIERRLGHSVAAVEHRRRWRELEEARRRSCARPSTRTSMPSVASPTTAPSYWRPSRDWPRSAGPWAGRVPQQAGAGSPSPSFDGRSASTAVRQD